MDAKTREEGEEVRAKLLALYANVYEGDDPFSATGWDETAAEYEDTIRAHLGQDAMEAAAYLVLHLAADRIATAGAYLGLMEGVNAMRVMAPTAVVAEGLLRRVESLRQIKAAISHE